MAKEMVGKKIVNTTADSIAASAAAVSTGRGLPPVEQWTPPFCGDIDMRIARDGTWFYMGTPIGRPALVKLFSGIIKREGDAYFLVTPVEKVGITVDDAPFVAVDFDVSGAGDTQAICFVTQVGDRAIAGPEHPIRVERCAQTGAPAPYVLIRRNLEALIDRKSFYRLVEQGTHSLVEGKSWFGVWSGGAFFPFIRSEELA